jgi:replicative superfamily II helicase
MNESIINRLTNDVLQNNYFFSLYDKCSVLSAKGTLKEEVNQKDLTPKELKDSLRFADILSNSNESDARNKAYQIVTFLNSIYFENPIYKTVAKAVYSKLGNFPAIHYLEAKDKNLAELPFERMIGMEAKKLIQQVPDSKEIFTDSQYELFQKLSNSQKYSFSGPTSMGKSFIIKAFVRKALKNSPPDNIAILVPTRALINQFAFDLKEELKDILEQYHYKVLTNSDINDLLTDEFFNYILVLTPERLLSYLSKKENPSIGFLFVDEAHKLAQDNDSRSVTTYTAIERTINKYGRNLKLYFSSPNVSNPEVFLKLFDKDATENTFKTDESPVAQNLYFIDLEEKRIELIQKDKFTPIEIIGFDKNFLTLPSIINYLGKGENNLIYNNSKQKTISCAKEFADYLPKPEELSTRILNAVSQIREYIHQDYYLAELLEKKIAYHHGKLPQLIRNLVENLYKSEEVQNVFCTSTLLEGVNMPTKNLFILNNKNGRRKLDSIDFWNLTGRAGRLNKELFGNIFCIKNEDCEWENKNEILKKEPIALVPTIITRINKNLQKIEKILNEKDISGTEQEKEILKYIANIISIDTLETKATYKSPIIEQLITNKKNEIIELAKSKTKGITIPLSILSSNQSINIFSQQVIYDKLKQRHSLSEDIKLPTESDYDTCLSVLKKMYDLYEWVKAEKRLRNENSLRYFATIMNNWIKGFSLSQIIRSSLDYHRERSRDIKIGYENNQPIYVQFEYENIEHINIVIEDIIDDIEYILRFLLEKYFNHYYQVLVEILGEENAGENWAARLEYGTQNRIVIALQNVGLSRQSALSIYNKSKESLEIKDSKLISINKALALKNFKHNSIEFEEVSRML